MDSQRKRLSCLAHLKAQGDERGTRAMSQGQGKNQEDGPIVLTASCPKMCHVDPLLTVLGEDQRGCLAGETDECGNVPRKLAWFLCLT